VLSAPFSQGIDILAALDCTGKAKEARKLFSTGGAMSVGLDTLVVTLEDNIKRYKFLGFYKHLYQSHVEFIIS
jgi:hypothetical protein